MPPCFSLKNGKGRPLNAGMTMFPTKSIQNVEQCKRWLAAIMASSTSFLRTCSVLFGAIHNHRSACRCLPPR